jgi:hypothetical protein
MLMNGVQLSKDRLKTMKEKCKSNRSSQLTRFNYMGKFTDGIYFNFLLLCEVDNSLIKIFNFSQELEKELQM